MNYDSFSHGQITSKVWLCEEFESHIPPQQNVYILGGWHNVLGFMLLTRRPDHYASVVNIDTDPEAIAVANKICDAWIYAPIKVVNVVGDCNEQIVATGSVVINCSVEHFERDDWFFNLPKGTLVCIQSSDMTDPEEPWLIKSANPDMKTLVNRFPVTDILHMGTKRIQYNHFGYNRFMLIGRT